MPFSDPKNFHFIGICGTAMGAIAVGLKQRGYQVTGSDENVYPPMSTYLRENGVEVFAGYSEENVPADADVIVIGNALGRGNPEVEYVLDHKLYYLSLPEVLKEWFMRGKHNYVVCGTHGKTTTTSLLAWLLESAGLEPDFMIGGIPRNFKRGARLDGGEHFVIEGDEYDTAFFDKRSKFVHYLPETVIINNIEFDHADIFRDLEAILVSFSRLVRIIPRNGRLLINGDDPNCEKILAEAQCPVIRVGLGENCEARISEITESGGSTRFKLNDQEYQVPLLGEFNVRNAAMGLIAAGEGVEPAALQKGLESFEGVARRMEVRAEIGGTTIIDDFGHHPTALSATLKTLRSKYPGQRLWALFEPRSNTTRRAVFQDSLPEALALADSVVIANVARLEQIPEHERLNPERVVQTLMDRGVSAWFEQDPEAIVERLLPLVGVDVGDGGGEVVVIFSNGGFGGLHDKLITALRNREVAR